MQFAIKINGVDFTPYISSGGIVWEETTRVSRAVTTLNGTSYLAQINKIRCTVNLTELRDEIWNGLREALQIRPALVDYNKPDGTKSVKEFYVIAMREPVRTVKGGNTFYRNIAFSLEEK